MKLKVISPFRDITNFFVKHEVGDMVEVYDPSRIANLIDGGFCEKVTEEKVEVAANHEPVAEVKAEAEAEMPKADPEPVAAKSETKTARKPRKASK